MASRGANETDKLRQNVEEQMQRLLSQLEDLETEKDNLDPAEYKEMYDDTIQQLKEFKASLEKMMAGNMTLVDQLSNYKNVRHFFSVQLLTYGHPCSLSGSQRSLLFVFSFLFFCTVLLTADALR